MNKIKVRPWLVIFLVLSLAGCGAPRPGDQTGSAEIPIQTIGVIGGISWVSSIEYYRLLNEMVNKKLGGLNSAKVLMYSIEFGKFSEQERLAKAGDWRPLRATMLEAAQRLKKGGADFIIVASNTMNSADDIIEQTVQIPVLRITDAAGAEVVRRGLKTVGLLGTKYTMEAGFYKESLEKKFGLKIVLPDQAERDYINQVIFDQLCAGQILESSRKRFIRVIDRLVKEEGAQGVILGCTEIPLLIKQSDVSVPVFDTMTLHCQAAVDRAVVPKK